VIRLVIRQVTFEQMQVLIDRFDQAAAAGQQVYRANATVDETPGSFGQIVMEVRRRREHGGVLLGPRHGLKSSFDSSLASSQFSG